MRLAGIVLAVVTRSAWAAAPTPEEAAKLLKPPGGAKVRAVLKVLDDLGGGRFPVVFEVEGPKACVQRTVGRAVEKACFATAKPAVAVVAQGQQRAVVVLQTAQPATAQPDAPEDAPEPLEVESAQVRDLDGDARATLLLTLRYAGPWYWEVGATSHRDLAVVTLEPLAVELRVELDRAAATRTVDQWESQLEVVGKTADAPAALLLTRGLRKKTAPDETVTSQARWVRDPRKHTWAPAKP
jgi:hypothetical protein